MPILSACHVGDRPGRLPWVIGPPIRLRARWSTGYRELNELGLGRVGMNVSHANEQEIDPAVWERPQMRQALAARDMAAVYGLLQRIGISQRHIAALTAQSQSEISEILKGRQVMAYEVLGRIADGLGIPRGYMGLAYDDSCPGPPRRRCPATTATSTRTRRSTDARPCRTGDHRRGEGGERHVDASPGLRGDPAPQRIGLADIEQVETVTRTLRALDHQHGGGVCRDAVVAQLAWSAAAAARDLHEQGRPPAAPGAGGPAQSGGLDVLRRRSVRPGAATPGPRARTGQTRQKLLPRGQRPLPDGPRTPAL